MYHKSKYYRIHQDERVVTKRQKIAKLFGYKYKDGTLRKHNMSCNCGMCDVQHPGGVKKAEIGFKDKNKLKVMKERINEVI